MRRIEISFLSIIFLLAALNSQLQAQSNFEKDFTSLHKKAIMTCGMIKNPETHKKPEILQSLDEFKMQVSELQKNYANHPPVAYENDPLWKSYFMEFNDIVNTVQTRVENNNYKAAAMNCSRFCMLFNKIHTINGQVDLTDMMFRWLSQMTMTTHMVNATNYKDAVNYLKQVKTTHKNLLDLKKSAHKPDEFNKEFEQIDQLYNKWVNALENRDYQLTSDTYNQFNAAFGKVFLMSLD